MSGWDDSWRGRVDMDESTRIGHHCVLVHPERAHLRGPCRIDPFALVVCGLRVEPRVHVSSHVFMNGTNEVRLHEWSFVGSGSRLLTASDDYSGEHGPIGPFGRNLMDRGDVVFSEFSGVAVGTTVLPGVVLPDGCCIAAHGLVRSSEGLEPWSVMTCVPGKPPLMLYRRDEAVVRAKAADPAFWREGA